MKNYCTILTLFILFNLNAQNSRDFLKVLPEINEFTPDWAVEMYKIDPNVKEVAKMYEDFYKENPFVKTTHTQNYKYWIREIEYLVGKDGYIDIRKLTIQDSIEIELQKEFKKNNFNSNIGRSSIPGSENEWVPMGPFATYDAGDTTKLQRGHKCIFSIVRSKSNPNLLICGTQSGGIYKSEDKGENWSPMGQEHYIVSNNDAVAIHPTNDNIFFVTTSLGLWRSEDKGLNWTKVTSTYGFYEIKFHPTNPDTIFAAGNSGLYRSNDGGDTWMQEITETCFDLDFHPNNPDTIYLLKRDDMVSRDEVWRSDDAGATWHLKNNGYFGNTGSAGGKIAVTPAAPDVVYVCLIGNEKSGDNGWLGIYRSSNKGENWVNPDGQDGGPYGPINGTDPWNVAAYPSGAQQGFYNFDLEASDTDSNKIWVGTIRLVESTDGGATFTSIGGNSTQRLNTVHVDIQDISVYGNEVWVATDGGITFSEDELQTAKVQHKGIDAAEFWGFDTGWNEDVFTGGRYHNGNASWHEEYGIGNALRAGGAEEPTGFINLIENRKVYHSQGFRTNVNIIPESLSDPLQFVPGFDVSHSQHFRIGESSGIYFDPRYADHMIIGNWDKIYKSTNGGLTFEVIHTFPFSTGKVTEIEISRSNPDVMYCVFKPLGGRWDPSEIWKTTDGGYNWAVLSPVPGDNTTMRLTINPEDENEVWVCNFFNGLNPDAVFRTLDGGDNWINMSSNVFNYKQCTDILYQGGTNDIVYVSTNGAVYYWDVTSGNWNYYGSGLPSTTNSMKINPFHRDGELRMGTRGRGVWARSMVDTLFNPIAQPITYTDSIFCKNDTVQFDCYSILKHQGASWDWSFSPSPVYISSTTARNPKVIFGNEGSYDVTLSISNGQSGTDTKTITDMVTVLHNCEPDTTAGNALSLEGTYNSRAIIPPLNLYTNTLSISAWIKIDSTNNPWSDIIFSDDGGTDAGLKLRDNNELRYEWNNSAWDSGLEVPTDEWTHVAMVIEPTKATIYMNGVPAVNNVPHDLEEFNGITEIGAGTKGEIDEICIWNRVLNIDEIRELRHLTKDGVVNDSTLIAYYQFNEASGSRINNKSGIAKDAFLLFPATRVVSSAPVGSGSSQGLDISAGGTIDFSDVGARLYFSNDCDLPQGDMVISRINNSPHLPINTNVDPEQYWIINYYDSLGLLGYTRLDSIELTTTNTGFINSLSNPSDAFLHLREANSNDLSWQTKAKGKAQVGNALGFGKANGIDGSFQLHLTHGGFAFNEQDALSPCEADTIPGDAFLRNVANGFGSYGEIPPLNLNTNTFTVSAWVKKIAGYQFDWAGIVYSRDNNTNAGLIIRTNQEIRAFWNGSHWGSGHILPDEEWTHLALVIEPNKTTVYMDGIPSVNNSVNNNIEEFDGKTLIGMNQNNGRGMRGEVDEVCIWNRALDTDEIRALRHLTKEDTINDPTFVAYYQFNEKYGGDKIYDKSGNGNDATLRDGATRIISSAPIGGGTSSQQTINSGGTYTFGDTGVEMTFPSTGTYPNGDIVVSRINGSANVHPQGGIVGEGYWIINNYGTNAVFVSLSSIDFKDPNYIGSSTELSDILLHNRAENAHGNTWLQMDESDNLDASTGTITFEEDLDLTTFGQYIISNKGTRGWIGIENEAWNNPMNWGEGIIPNQTSDVIIPSNTPFQPTVNVPVEIRSLTLMPGAELKIETFRKLEIKE